MSNPNKTFPFLMGADPEILLFYGQRRLDARKAMSEVFKKTHDPRNLGFNIKKENGLIAGEVGWDNHNATGEFRPIATGSPEEMTENFKVMIQALIEKLPSVEITALSIGEPIGGHIHLDVPHEMNTIGGGSSLQRAKNTLASLCIPVIASEHRISSSVRHRGTDYGDLNNYRQEHRGNGLVLELRGLSAEWLTSPKITQATFAYIGVVWNEIRKNLPKLLKDKRILKNQTQISAMQDLIFADYRPIKESLMKNTKSLIQTFEMYPVFKDEIDFILNPERVTKEKQKYGWNLNKGWGHGTRKEPSKKDLLSTKKVANAIKNINTDLTGPMCSITYNDDYNMELFAQSISERILGMSWTLKEEYFLFGLKKGIEGFLVSPMEKSNGQDIYLEFPTVGVTRNQAQNTMQKMKEKATKARGYNTVVIDPKSGKVQQGINCLLIGIPYGLRMEKNSKPLIELIWDIENKKKSGMHITDMKEKRQTDGTNNTDIKEEMMSGNARVSYNENDAMDQILKETTTERQEQPNLITAAWPPVPEGAFRMPPDNTINPETLDFPGPGPMFELDLPDNN